jgi:iron complex transport system substrate-binding protein
MCADQLSTPSPQRGRGFLFPRVGHRLSAAVAAALLLGACAAGASPAPVATPSLTPTQPVATATFVPPTPTATFVAATSIPTATASGAATPTTAATPTSPAITVTGDDGVSITLASRPTKIVSLTPATSELLFALGDGAELVGRTDSDDYPPEVADVPVVATFEGVQTEKVVAATPDLVIAGGNGFTHQDDIDQLRNLKIPVLVVYADDVPGVLADIDLVGTAVGEADKTKAMTDAIQARFDEVKSAVGGLDTPRTFYELGVDTQIYGPAPDSFVADMVTLAGGAAITTGDPASFSISLEQLVAQDPQVIVLGDAQYGTCPDAVAKRAGWKTMTAVKDDAIRPVFDTIVTRPGPRIGDGLAALALAIHPDAQLAPPAGQPAMCGASAAPSPS